MPDSAAERKRRSRAHGRGDHSLCLVDRCRDATASPEPAVSERPVEAPVQLVDDEFRGGIELAVQAYVESLSYAQGDPRSILGTIAIRLAKRVDDSGAVPAAVRELRVLLAQLTEVPNGPAGQVDEIRVQRALRRLDALITNVA